MVDLPKLPALRLDGKRALVTGASRGIGLGCAAALAEIGADVTMAARGEAQLAEAVEHEQYELAAQLRDELSRREMN